MFGPLWPKTDGPFWPKFDTTTLPPVKKQASGKNRSAGGGRGIIVLSTCIPPASARSVPQSRAGIGQRDEVMLAPLRRGRAGVRKLPPPCIPRLRSGGHAFAGRKPLPSPKGEAWGRTPPPRPLPLSSCNSQLRTLTRAGEGGRGFASSPRPASPRLRSGDHAYAGETPSRPLKGKPRGVLPPPRPLHLSPLRSPQGGTGGQAAPCNPCPLPPPVP